MLRTVSALLLTTLLLQGQDPSLLLTPKRLHRLQRDRDRQTQRWVDFEAYAKSRQNSPEQNCTAAVYKAVTGEASPDAVTGCPASFTIPGADAAERFLLAMKPSEVEHPTWQQHVSALALVNLDPNNGAAQFLQGWAMADRFELHDGPGMVYEFLWGNPYLPGVSYRNMDPWFYDNHGRLLGRTSWDVGSCWVSISGSKVDQQNCPSGWDSQPFAFGKMTLVPADGRCTELPPRQGSEQVIVWKLKPGRKLIATAPSKDHGEFEADDAGLWRVPPEGFDRVCTAR